MNPDDRIRLSAGLLLGLPILFWFQAVKHTESLTKPKWKSAFELLKHTHEKPILLGAALGGLALAILVIWLIHYFGKSEFAGAPFSKFLRGTRIGSPGELSRNSRERGTRQITVAGIPMPRRIENLHLLVAGSTGAGKSVLIRELVYAALLRGDRIIVADPNGEMMAKFFREGDVILNPYDARTAGWTFFNEIRNPAFDFKRFALSIVPRGKNAEAEEWASYARLLLGETAKKLALTQQSPSLAELNHWLTIKPPAELKAFLTGTAAESLFVGAEKALASARFVLSNKLPEHVAMPPGDFSLRAWLADSTAGNLWLTWREDQQESLKPLLSAWVDILCTSILSLPPVPAKPPERYFRNLFRKTVRLENERRIFLVIDELASLDKLGSLEAALTKGRKHGLCVACGLLSVSQLDDIYGKDEAQTLRACFRSLAVLGGAKTDPATCEEMSKALGEHEVEREDCSRTIGHHNSTNRKTVHARERVVMPAEIAALPDLTGYVAFAGSSPIAKVELKIVRFKDRVPAFVER